MNVPADKIAEILGGQRILGRPIHTMRELDDVVRAGIPKTALDRVLQMFAPAHGADRTAQYRNRIVSRATYQRAARFNAQVSETTERLARLFALAMFVFEDESAARHFLIQPHPELGNRTPFEVALTEIGGREVEEVIERGLHGLPA